MNENCLDCRQAILNTELNKKVEAIELDMKALKNEVSIIKQNEVGYQKDISNIFKLSEETKKLYEKIMEKIDADVIKRKLVAHSFISVYILMLAQEVMELKLILQLLEIWQLSCVVK